LSGSKKGEAYKMTFQKVNTKLGQYIFENHDFNGTPDDFLNLTAPLIGYMVHIFNSLDEQLNSAICTLINDRTDEPGAIIIHKMSYSSKVELFNNLVISIQNAFEKEISSFNALIENLKKCGALRNAVVHADWDNMNEKGFTYVKMSFTKKGIQQHYWQFTPDSLNTAINFIRQTYLDFEKYDDEKQEMYNS
jgi:hypothetical protein